MIEPFDQVSAILRIIERVAEVRLSVRSSPRLDGGSESDIVPEQLPIRTVVLYGYSHTHFTFLLLSSSSLLCARMSVAGRVLQTRALQCSFSSVFHLRRAGMDSHRADFVENLFVGSVGVPLVLLAGAGLWSITFPRESQ